MPDARHFAQRALRHALMPTLSMAVSRLTRENAVVFGLVSEHSPGRARWIREIQVKRVDTFMHIPPK